jgi:hypothetical protein
LITLVEAIPGVRAIQLVQTVVASLELRLDFTPGHERCRYGKKAEARLRQHLARHGLETVERRPRPVGA